MVLMSCSGPHWFQGSVHRVSFAWKPLLNMSGTAVHTFAKMQVLEDANLKRAIVAESKRLRLLNCALDHWHRGRQDGQAKS